MNDKTNEQIVADALRDDTRLCLPDGGPVYWDAIAGHVLTNLRAAGRLTGEPSEEQVEAAAKAIADCHNPGMFERHPENWRLEARAALKAAGVAPQAECDCGAGPGSAVCKKVCATRTPAQLSPTARVVSRGLDADCAHGTCPSGCSHLMWACDACSCEGGWGASRDKLEEWASKHVCPAQPSPIVDEEKLSVRLAEMLYDDMTGTRGRFETSIYRDSWVKRVRAVVEALGGEGRDIAGEIDAEREDTDPDALGADAYINGLYRAAEIVRNGR